MKILSVILLGLFSVPSWAYTTYYVEDECTPQKHLQKVVYNIPENGPNSIGEIRTNRFGTYSRAGRSCLIKLVPPKGYGIVLTVKKVDFRNHEPCEDFIKIYSSEEDVRKLCGFQDNGRNGKSFFSDGKMNIFYHTEDGGYGFNDGIRLIFTAAKNVEPNKECNIDNQFKCANSRCIWIGAVCDGFNNCGDGSDESTSELANCANITPVTIAVIALGITTFFAIMISVCLCCCRAHRESSDKSKQITDFPSRPNGGYIPLPGYIYGTSMNTPRHLLYSPYHSAYPPATMMKRTCDGSNYPSPLDLPPPYKP